MQGGTWCRGRKKQARQSKKEKGGAHLLQPSPCHAMTASLDACLPPSATGKEGGGADLEDVLAHGGGGGGGEGHDGHLRVLAPELAQPPVVGAEVLMCWTAGREGKACKWVGAMDGGDGARQRGRQAGRQRGKRPRRTGKQGRSLSYRGPTRSRSAPLMLIDGHSTARMVVVVVVVSERVSGLGSIDLRPERMDPSKPRAPSTTNRASMSCCLCVRVMWLAVSQVKSHGERTGAGEWMMRQTIHRSVLALLCVTRPTTHALFSFSPHERPFTSLTWS